MRFEALAPQVSAVDGCASTVQAAILRGELAPGARLPPERELATSLGVSRLTLRAGLAKVAATGLLSVRHGSGYRVEDYRRRGGAELLPGLLRLARRRDQLAAMAEDLLQVRRALAQTVLEQLARRGKAGAERRFAARVDAFAAAVETGSREAIAAADLDLVAALLDETSSQVMALCLNPIVQVLSAIPSLRAAIYAEPERNLLGWRALQAWLVRRSADQIGAMIAILAENDRQTVRRLARAGQRGSK